MDKAFNLSTRGKTFGAKDATGAVLCLFNLITFVFFLTYSIVRTGAQSASAMMIVSLITVAFNFLYAAIALERYGVLLIAVNLICLLINTAGSMLVAISTFRLSVSIAGCIALTVMPLLDSALISSEIIRPKKKKEETKLSRIITLIYTIGGFALTSAILIVGAITLSGTTVINSNTVSLSLIMIFSAIGGFCLGINGVRRLKLKNMLYAVAAMIILLTVSVTCFAVVEGFGYKDAKQAEISFQSAFGNKNYSAGNMRKTAYNVADEFIGIRTVGYDIDRDIVYFSEEENGIGYSLRYDCYYPTVDAHKSVLVNIHGSGGDKDTGNYAHKNKYFASIGYVVYDIQYGDFNERGIGFNSETFYNKIGTMALIDKFFVYAKTNNEVGADFSNTFITGVSFGGNISGTYGISYKNALADVGIELKGIIPVYPGYPYGIDVSNNIYAYLEYVTKDSVPCLTVMSMSDRIVNPATVELTEQAYVKVGNPNYASIKISFAGHGCDGAMTGRANQLMTYYTERFMAALR